MLPTKGLYTDCTEVNQPKDTYRFAKNIVDTNVIGVKENEEGFTELAQFAPYTIIGIKSTDVNVAVLFSTNNTDSEIGIVDLSASVYTQIYNDPELNFNTGFPIEAEFRKGVNGDRIITWTDKRNPLRILNIDNVAEVQSVEDLNSFQAIQNPTLSSYSINDFGGALITGSYIPITRYKNVDGSETNWFVHDHTFQIVVESKSRPFQLMGGDAPETPSPKSITFTLSNTDSNFDTIIIGYIKTVNNITSVHQVSERDNSASLTVTITGSETTTELSLEEILTPSASYSTVGTITQLNGQLYAADLTVEPLPDLQEAALDITLNYTLSLVNVISNVNSNKDVLPPSLMPGEVYAFYLGVELNNGSYAFYHIPGRAPDSDDRDVIVDSGMGLTYKRFQVRNTSNIASPSNMGYWENEGELYPDNPVYGALAGQPVRHHRIPALDRIIATDYTGDNTVGVTHLPHIGVTASNVNIPTEIQSKIKRWKIFFAKKTSLNSLVVGADLAHAACPVEDDSSIRWSTGGNWKLQGYDLGTDDWEDFNTPVFDNLRIHSLDFYLESPQAPTYAAFLYTLSRANLNAQALTFRSEGAKLTTSGDGYGQMSSAIIDYTIPTRTTRTDIAFEKRLDDFAYLPSNSLVGRYKSQYNEAAYTATIYNPGLAFDSLTADDLSLKTASPGYDRLEENLFFKTAGTDSVGPEVNEKTMYLHYMRLLTSVHASFDKQDLVPMEGFGLPSSTTATFVGGSVYLCYMSYLTAAPRFSNPEERGASDEENHTTGVRVWHGYIGYSRNNWNFRYETQGQIGTYYYGKVDPKTLFSPTVTSDLSNNYIGLIDTSEQQNVVQFDTSLVSPNIYKVGTIWSVNVVNETNAPNTVIWSNTQAEESKEFSWRTFPSANRYVMPRDKGRIVKVQGFKNRQLIIHHEHAIFRTRTDVQVSTDQENVFLSTNTLFSLPPEDLVPTTTGYGGTQNKFGCILTKVGYAYPDNIQGKIFLYNGENLQEISSNGNRIFFRDFMKIEDNEDNPFVSSGYTLAYDEKYNRLLVTKKDGSTSWTASYNPATSTWISYHDYVPDYYFSTLGSNLYSIKNNIVYNNYNGPKGTFYADVTYPSYIDITFNEYGGDKQVVAVSWITEVYPNTYSTGQPSSTLDYNTTLTHITVRDADHCTGRTALIRTTQVDDYNLANMRNLNRTWYFDDVRDFVISQGFIKGFYDSFTVDTTKLDTNIPWYEQRRFVDKFVICRLEYDNIQDKRVILLDTNVDFTNVQR